MAISVAFGGSIVCTMLWCIEASIYELTISHELLSPAPEEGSAAFCKLGHGYDLQMSHDWSTAYLLHDPAWTGEGNFPERSGVPMLQIAGDQILGESRQHGAEGPFFILDSTNGTMKTAQDIFQFTSLAHSSGIKLALKPSRVVYYDQRSGRIPLNLWITLILTTTATIVSLLIYFLLLNSSNDGISSRQ
jgi:hypothetical protein